MIPDLIIKSFKFSTALLIIIFNGLYSQNIDREKTDSLLRIRGEAVVALPNKGLKSFQIIPDELILDRYTDSLIYFYVNRASFRQLEESGLEYFYVVPPSLAQSVVMAKTAEEVLSGLGYPAYQQYLEIMDYMQRSYPAICFIDTIGYSIKGRLILSARIHSGDFVQGAKPVVMLSSTIHGDEPAGYVLMLMLMNDLLENYGNDEKITDLIDNSVILINPLSNPDGTYFVSDTTVNGAIRMNSNYVDLNRDFPDCRITQNYSPEGSQLETIAMANYLKDYKPSISANFHSGAELINYPWDRKWPVQNNKEVIKYHADNNWFINLSKDYVDSARSIKSSYMRTDFNDGFVMGTNWYDVTGSRQDYITYFLGGRELTIELSAEKFYPASGLSELWNINKNSLINYLFSILTGLHGNVRDSVTNEPVKARIYIPGHDSLNSFVYSHAETGNFFRYLDAGSYNLWIEADSFVTEIVRNVKIEYNSKTLLDIRLKPVNTIRDLVDNIRVFPNPFSDRFKILFHAETAEITEIRIFNISGKKIYGSLFTSSPGINHITIYLTNYPSGVYFLKLITRKGTNTIKISKAE